MKISGVYVISNMMDGRKYIGQSNDIEKRWYEHRRHLNAGTCKNKFFQRSWDKYGEGAFRFEILCECSEELEMNAQERELIALFETTDRRYGYNLTEGGDACPMRDPKVRRRQRAAVRSAEECQRRREFARRQWQTNREYQDTMRLANLKRWKDPEYRTKMSRAVAESNRRRAAVNLL